MALKFGPDILDKGPQGTKRGKKLSAFGRAFKLAYDTKPGSTFTFGGKKYKAIKKQEGKGPPKDRVEDKSIGAGTIIKGKRDTTKSKNPVATTKTVTKKKKPLRPSKFRNLAGQKFGQRKDGGMTNLKPVAPEQQKSLGQLPEKVRNRMGYAKKGTMVQARGCGMARKKPTKIT